TGNANTNSVTNFLGTTNPQDLSIRTNNIENVRITQKSQIQVLNSGQSVYIGQNAGANAPNAPVVTPLDNTFVGFNAGAANTTGTRNTAVGSGSLNMNTTGIVNTSI